MALLEIKNLTYHYPDTEEPALSRIDLSIKEGEFVVVAGGSGSGKSSLARAIAGLIPDFYGGRIGGSIKLEGRELKEINRAKLAQKIGIVFQDPENQLIMTNVEQELVFGMENLGLPHARMKKAVMEMSGALSLYPFLKSNITQLSGGLKQKVALASVLALQPDILILDEPTSQLDPVAGEEILTILRRMNEENGITVILIEHRLERCLHLADRIIFMEKGRIVHDGQNIRDALKKAFDKGDPFITPLAKLFAAAGSKQIPLTIKEGREIIRQAKSEKPELSWSFDSEPVTTKNTSDIEQLQEKTAEKIYANNTPLLEVERLWFTYENGQETLKDISLKIYPAEFLIIMGENTAGKTTLLKNIRGLLHPSRGNVTISGRSVQDMTVEEQATKVGYLAQNPNDYLFRPSVREEILFTLKNLGMEKDADIEDLMEKFILKDHADYNPRDLSTGERQRVAMASVLAANPPLVLLDEPTRGLDNQMKAILGRVLRSLQEKGHGIIVVTHDVEFAAEYGEKIILMSGGQIIAQGEKHMILSESTFYSPQTGKLFHDIDNSVLTISEGVQALTKIVFRGGIKVVS